MSAQVRRRTAVIVGAGPAGLTAALELLRRTDIRPIVVEATGAIGGLARTVVHNGNRMDIGGHRFFSKSDRVTQWWLQQMPLGGAQDDPGRAMLLRPRRSRIYFLGQMFDYPLALTAETLRKLGAQRAASIVASYVAERLRPRRPIQNLEDFFIERFGQRLYELFFKSYTEKVWGVPCAQIPAKWGAQRIRGMSLLRAVGHELRRRWPGAGRNSTSETSLCEEFLYPRLGPGQLWEHVAAQVTALGGEVRLHAEVDRLKVCRDRIVAVETRNTKGDRHSIKADFVFSTMPVPVLLCALGDAVPPPVRSAGNGLRFRDFITVGVLVKRFAITDRQGGPATDTWIYIQEPGIRMGRLQIFNNWSPALVADAATVWLGLEYFCAEGDDLWTMDDGTLGRFAARELECMGMVQPSDVLDAHVVRVPKAYPAYLGTYDRFDQIRNYTDTIGNLFLVGRNGMHRYNNQDHSMLSAMTAVDQIVAGKIDREALWSINTEPEYHEERSANAKKPIGTETHTVAGQVSRFVPVNTVPVREAGRYSG